MLDVFEVMGDDDRSALQEVSKGESGRPLSQRRSHSLEPSRVCPSLGMRKELILAMLFWRLQVPAIVFLILVVDFSPIDDLDI